MGLFSKAKGKEYMMKVLAWLAFFGLVGAALYKKAAASHITILRSGPTPHYDDNGAEIMVQCAHCGVYLPSSEAFHRDGLHFCSAEHLKAYRPA
jgi:hypothetical protein